MLGTGEDDRLWTADPPGDLTGGSTFCTLMSTLHDPIASAVYRQKIGSVAVVDSFLERQASETRAFPMKEYSGGGDSKKGSSDAKC